jgi:phosphoenolpyruvate---glycerone phosphotransferase subunit DhaK
MVAVIRFFLGETHMKKLINDPGDVVRESLAGFAAAHSDIVKVLIDPVYVVRADAPVRRGRAGRGRRGNPGAAWLIERGQLHLTAPHGNWSDR